MRSYVQITGLLILMLSACQPSLYNTPKTRAVSIKRLIPPDGMVYIPSGTFLYKMLNDDKAEQRKVSVSAFFIDKTEVNNKQYQAFVNWVADSVAITDYLHDDSFYLPATGATVGTRNKEIRLIDWSKVNKISPLWKKAPPEVKEKLAPMMTMLNGARMPNPDLMIYRFYYIRMDGVKNNEYKEDTVRVYPHEAVWSADFPNSQMTVMDANYFTNKVYQYNPVVGVSWKQARAYADWRSTQLRIMIKNNPNLRNFKLSFSLPTEAQWQYAAEAKLDPADTLDHTVKTTVDKVSGKEQLSLNFKQGEGSYSSDGSTFTLPVTSYTPNAFGIYNMAGNVSEWTLDAFSPSSSQLVNDLNPALLYDASINDAPLMRRKVVRGGSWKDNGEMLNTDTRSFDDQDAAHSYIGFRCVMAAFELTGEQVKTRKYTKK
ncbi:SUMF1/EgtB/PvdO family nonheme iron enzyme [Mucilaginibacter sp. BJC16-A38]|uniref:type IX secretion system lipoprotein PorK/GldK n=1 Tax=Mucilaginibacter phenanthrenivorans TaxID=1234842 RepID=UPI0021587A1A|nr:SUMF1/EgtB/PvdO family nonheme iron enzyme [Mucilaginibacter phenanthrenivorans]MCR8559613.1 SUMF1/EgtB/PvdO family nonheme iron enzyme [Mucilaginibacter phenanthrenivorans]